MIYKTPGVFIEEIAKFPPSIAQVETAIPAFIGYTERATANISGDLILVPTRIKSLIEYEVLFGGPKAESVTINVKPDNQIETVTMANPSQFKMYYALRMYFDNGGGPCYIISLGLYEDLPNSEPKILQAMGNGGNDIPVGGLSKVKKVDEVTLLLFPDNQFLTGTNYHSLYQQALAQCADLGDRFAIMDLRKTDPGIGATGTPVDFFRNEIGNNNLKYGAAYWPWLKTPVPYHYNDDSVTFSQPDDGSGSAGPFDTLTLGRVRTLVESDPDALNPADKALQTELKKYFTNRTAKDLAAELSKMTVEMPPSSTMAGVYAAVDSTRGVWKAPANVSLNTVSGLTEKINAKDQRDLNVHFTGKSINAIRFFTGKGNLVWGARTLDGNSNEWRYISVRRFFNFAEESIKKGTEPFVFEPNDRNTWTKVRGMIENFLLLQWRAGALAGATPEDAFFVQVGLPETMTSLDILEGRMNVEIGMAVVRPAEFIILKFSHKMQES